eukprot:6723483-Prymnesium_polylepis.1
MRLAGLPESAVPAGARRRRRSRLWAAVPHEQPRRRPARDGRRRGGRTAHQGFARRGSRRVPSAAGLHGASEDVRERRHLAGECAGGGDAAIAAGACAGFAAPTAERPGVNGQTLGALFFSFC